LTVNILIKSAETNWYLEHHISRVKVEHVMSKKQRYELFRASDCCLTLIKKRRYQSYCARHVSGIIFIRYAQSRKAGKPDTGNLKISGSK
jgi:hypothetical protein